MPAHRSLNVLDTDNASLKGSLYKRQKRRPPLDNPNESKAVGQLLRTRLMALRLRHRELDVAISALYETGSYDQFLVTRLKKRKLKVKDEIARVEAMQDPQCERCDTSGWVCKSHILKPSTCGSQRFDACGCDAGVPCPDCNSR